MSGIRVRAAVAVLAATLTLIAFSGVADAARSGSRATPSRATRLVKGIGTKWSPITVNATKGTLVKWKAVSNSHTVTAYGKKWHFNHQLPFGSTVKHLFPNAGVYKFRCTIHSALVNGVCQGMCGKIVIH